MSADRRALILRYLDEQIALCEKATPGEWSFSPQKGKPGHCFQAQVWRWDGESLLALEATDDPQSSRDAQLIASQRTGYPLALAALRAETLAHEVYPANGRLWCSKCGSPHDLGLDAHATVPKACPTISRIFTSLGLQED